MITIRELVEAADIVAYIGQYTELEQKSDGDYWGLTPFQFEKTPSFSVDPSSNRWYDFSTGCGGDLLTFIQKYHNCSFTKALELLQQFVGLDAESVVRSAGHLEVSQIIRQLANVNKKQEKICTAKELPDDYMDRFMWDSQKLSAWIDEGISEKVLFDYGVRYDPYTDSIVYPVWNESGKIFTVGMRTLKPNYKELKIPKYIYSNPIGAMPVVYAYRKNIEAIKNAGRIILFEGAKSVMKTATYYGSSNATALLTSHVNDNQFKLLVKTGVPCVFALDSDVRPWEDKNIQRLTRFCKVEMVLNRDGLLGAKESPVDHGQEVWEYLYERRSTLN